MAGDWIAGTQEADEVVVKGVGFGVGTDGHADGAVGAGFTPELVAGFHLALPLDDPADFFFGPGLNGVGRAISGAFFADLAKMLHT